MTKSFRLAIFAGPSGGHLFPALTFAESFRERFPESHLELITGKRGKVFSKIIEAGPFDRVNYFEDFPFLSGISLRSFVFLLKLLQAFFHAFFYLREMKPDLCVGFGSYISCKRNNRFRVGC